MWIRDENVIDFNAYKNVGCSRMVILSNWMNCKTSKLEKTRMFYVIVSLMGHKESVNRLHHNNHWKLSNLNN